MDLDRSRASRGPAGAAGAVARYDGAGHGAGPYSGTAAGAGVGGSIHPRRISILISGYPDIQVYPDTRAGRLARLNKAYCLLSMPAARARAAARAAVAYKGMMGRLSPDLQLLVRCATSSPASAYAAALLLLAIPEHAIQGQAG
eukprot:SAG31_NODE_611_length_13558_cov_224.959730_12_plen_144_part_00